MKKKTIAFILKLPVLLIVASTFFASIYLAYTKSYDIGWSTPITLGVIILLYIIGMVLERKKEDF